MALCLSPGTPWSKDSDTKSNITAVMNGTEVLCFQVLGPVCSLCPRDRDTEATPQPEMRKYAPLLSYLQGEGRGLNLMVSREREFVAGSRPEKKKPKNLKTKTKPESPG